MKKLITLLVAVLMVVSAAVSVSAANNSPVADKEYSVEIFNDVDTVKTPVKVVAVKAGETLVLTADSSIAGFQTWNIGSAVLVSGVLTDASVTIKPTADTQVYAVYKTAATVLTNNNVVVILPKDSVPANVSDASKIELKVEVLNTGADYTSIQKVMADVATKFVPYDITLLYNNVAVQPSGKVTVKLPIPSDMDSGKVAVYHVDGNKKTLFPHTVSDNFAVIETDHFSYYVLAEKTIAGSGDKSPQTGAAAASLATVMLLSAVGFVASSKKSK